MWAEAEKIAASWLAREDAGLNVAGRRDLEAWLNVSTENRVAYLRLKAIWLRTDRLAALKGIGRVSTPRSFLKQPARLGALAAMLAICFGTVVWLNDGFARGKAYATPVGAYQSVNLADGSRMELNTDTRVRAEVTAASRTVTLDSGEAYFDVIHDASRPFVVYAGNRRITDLGTKFSVYRNGDDVRVTVREGRVRVDVLKSQVADAPIIAEAGHVVMAKDRETLTLAKPDSQIASDLSWRSGMLVFNEQPLVDAADQFNRYNVRKIVVEGSARRIRIGGAFRADNVDAFVLLVHRGFGLSVKEQDKMISISR